MFGNIPRSIEYAVGWVADAIQWAAENNIVAIEATKEGMSITRTTFLFRTNQYRRGFLDQARA